MKKDTTFEKVYTEVTNFRKTMEDLHLLKQVASDLRSFRKMLKLRRYD